VARALPPPAAGDPHLGALDGSVGSRTRVATGLAGERFVRPTSLDDLLRIVAEMPNATLMAGGTDVMVGVTQKGDRPATLVSLAALPELRVFAVEADVLVLGAGLTLTEIEERLHDTPAAAPPLLAQLLPLFSSRLIRNRATLGGNLMTASPIGDAAPVLLALDASVTLARAAGSRIVPLREFFTGYRQTAAGPGEILVDVRVPRAQPAIQRFYKVSKRVLDDISTVAAAFAIEVDAAGRVAGVRIAYGGMAATPIRAAALEAALLGRSWTLETASALRSIADGVGTPMTDLRGSADYRRAMAGRLLEKCVADTANMAELAETGR
jgi:xanthine dehydrogenase small subunit